MAFQWWSGDLWRESLKCWKKKTGCMMSMYSIPTPPALRIALRLQFALFFFTTVVLRCQPLFCVWERKKTQNMMNIYSAIPQRTRSGEKVNLFCFCLILLFSLMFIPHSLFFLKMYILWIIVKGFFFFLFFAGRVGEGLRKCSHFFVFIFLLFYSMDTWNVIGPKLLLVLSLACLESPALFRADSPATHQACEEHHRPETAAQAEPLYPFCCRKVKCSRLCFRVCAEGS